MDKPHRVYPVDPPPYAHYGAPPNYVMLGEHGADPGYPPPGYPPPYRRTVPRYHHRKRRNGCLRCCCCCCCLLFITILLIVALIAFLYHYFQPKVPNYNVQNFEVTAFQAQPDFSLYTEFQVNVSAENPNKRISIIYGENCTVEVIYSDTMLCSGILPAFRQGNKNTTVMHVTLRGKSTFGSGLQEALMDNKEKKQIPLLITVKAPVRIEMESFTLKEFTVLVNCTLVVDNLSPKQKISILSKNYSFGVEV